MKITPPVHVIFLNSKDMISPTQMINKSSKSRFLNSHNSPRNGKTLILKFFSTICVNNHLTTCLECALKNSENHFLIAKYRKTNSNQIFCNHAQKIFQNKIYLQDSTQQCNSPSECSQELTTPNRKLDSVLNVPTNMK